MTKKKRSKHWSSDKFASIPFSIDKVEVTTKTRALKAEYTMEMQKGILVVSDALYDDLMKDLGEAPNKKSIAIRKKIDKLL